MTGMPWGWCFQLCWLQVMVNHSVFWCPFADGFVSESLGLFDRWSLSNPAKHYTTKGKLILSHHTGVQKNTYNPNSTLWLRTSHLLKTRTHFLPHVIITSGKLHQLCSKKRHHNKRAKVSTHTQVESGFWHNFSGAIRLFSAFKEHRNKGQINKRRDVP